MSKAKKRNCSTQLSCNATVKPGKTASWARCTRFPECSLMSEHLYLDLRPSSLLSHNQYLQSVLKIPNKQLFPQFPERDQKKLAKLVFSSATMQTLNAKCRTVLDRKRALTCMLSWHVLCHAAEVKCNWHPWNEHDKKIFVTSHDRTPNAGQWDFLTNIVYLPHRCFKRCEYSGQNVQNNDSMWHSKENGMSVQKKSVAQFGTKIPWPWPQVFDQPFAQILARRPRLGLNKTTRFDQSAVPLENQTMRSDIELLMQYPPSPQRAAFAPVRVRNYNPWREWANHIH